MIASASAEQSLYLEDYHATSQPRASCIIKELKIPSANGSIWLKLANNEMAKYVA